MGDLHLYLGAGFANVRDAAGGGGFGGGGGGFGVSLCNTVNFLKLMGREAVPNVGSVASAARACVVRNLPPMRWHIETSLHTVALNPAQRASYNRVAHSAVTRDSLAGLVSELGGICQMAPTPEGGEGGEGGEESPDTLDFLVGLSAKIATLHVTLGQILQSRPDAAIILFHASEDGRDALLRYLACLECGEGGLAFARLAGWAQWCRIDGRWAQRPRCSAWRGVCALTSSPLEMASATCPLGRRSPQASSLRSSMRMR
jgi:hypothetical protein